MHCPATPSPFPVPRFPATTNTPSPIWALIFSMIFFIFLFRYFQPFLLFSAFYHASFSFLSRYFQPFLLVSAFYHASFSFLLFSALSSWYRLCYLYNHSPQCASQGWGPSRRFGSIRPSSGRTPSSLDRLLLCA